MVAGVGGIRCWLAKHTIVKSGDGCRCCWIRCWLANIQLLRAGMVAGVGGIRCWLAKHTIAKSGDGCRRWGDKGLVGETYDC